MNTHHSFQSDADLIQAICGSVDERDAALHFLFNDDNALNKVRNYVVTQGGTAEDGEDVFQETVILFDRNIRQEKFRGDSSLKTYFFAISKWYWLTERRKRKDFIELDAHQYENLEEGIELQIIKTEDRDLLHSVLAQIGEKCKELLLLTGIASHKEIAEIKAYSSGDMAKKEVYRCREKLRNLIDQHPALNLVLKSIINK
jgi:RNA polymerase sigma factor (sigma-70 family)